MAEQEEDSKPCQPEDSKPCQPEDSPQPEKIHIWNNVLARVESVSWPVRQQEPGKHASSCFNVSSCCYSKSRRMPDIVGWAWASACVKHGLSNCMNMTYRNVTEHNITSGHTKCTYKNTAQELWVWLAGAVYNRNVKNGLYIHVAAAHWCSTICSQTCTTKLMGTDEALLRSLLTCIGPHRCM